MIRNVQLMFRKLRVNVIQRRAKCHRKTFNSFMSTLSTIDQFSKTVKHPLPFLLHRHRHSLHLLTNNRVAQKTRRLRHPVRHHFLPPLRPAIT